MKWILLFISLSIYASGISASCIAGDCINGHGTYIYKSGNKYIGDFKKGLPNGKGIMYYFNGDKYLGNWLHGKKHGKGKLIFKKADVYIGQFKNDAIHGQGRMTYEKGDAYNGLWHDDQPHGHGKYVFQNGSYYDGDFSHGSFHGMGTYVSVNGETLSGEWRAHKLIKSLDLNSDNSNEIMVSESTTTSRELLEQQRSNAQQKLKNCNNRYCHNEEGSYQYKDGSKYIGSFKNGKPFGQGVCNYISGNKYIGEWSDNAPHGKGIMHYTTGVVYGAYWDKGTPIKLLDSKEKYEIAGDILVDEDEEVKIWAVVVGVSKYQHMPTLNYSDDDAYRMYAFLKSPEGGALPDEQIEVIVDEDATRERILEKMQSTFYKADDNDMVILYFSGHGLQGNFLPIDYDGYNNKIRHDEIKDIFTRSNAKYKVCYADACYSGSMTAMKSVDIDEQLDHYYTELDNSKEGVAFMLSSKGAEYSLEDGGLRQGVFSHFLIRGLKGEANMDNNRFVTILELFKYVNFEVKKYTGSVQTPTISGNYDQNMPVSIIRK